MNSKEKDKGDNNSTQPTESNYIDQQENLMSSKKENSCMNEKQGLIW